MSKRPHLIVNYENDLAQYLTLLRAHDAVHPDRDECGGVGGCVLLRAECDQESVLTRYLERIASEGWSLRVDIAGDEES